jgi:hypothetical protein
MEHYETNPETHKSEKNTKVVWMVSFRDGMLHLTALFLTICL